MILRITPGGILRCLRKIFSIILTILFCDLLLRIVFVLVFFILLPFFIIYDHVIPSSLLFIQSARPVLDSFFGRLLPSLFALVLSLFPPVMVFYFTRCMG
uniref:Uncharacterized protein n=1 Tax=Sphaerodactylus townsendi TaxID=933632 RepID=A0ACB8E8W5_9SAUR